MNKHDSQYEGSFWVEVLGLSMMVAGLLALFGFIGLTHAGVLTSTTGFRAVIGAGIFGLLGMPVKVVGSSDWTPPISSRELGGMALAAYGTILVAAAILISNNYLDIIAWPYVIAMLSVGVLLVVAGWLVLTRGPSNLVGRLFAFLDH